MTTEHDKYRAQRAKRWAPVLWDDLLPGDIVTYVDHDGKSCDGTMESWQGGAVILARQTYKGFRLRGTVRVVPPLDPKQVRELKRRRLPAQFSAGERRRRKPYVRRT